MNITQFLNARLSEDHATADAAAGNPIPELLSWVEFTTNQTERAENHINRWTPERVIVEVEAKRRIIRWHFGQRDDTTPYGEPVTICHCGYDLPCSTLRLLALPYANHPDYQQEWTP